MVVTELVCLASVMKHNASMSTVSASSACGCMLFVVCVFPLPLCSL